MKAIPLFGPFKERTVFMVLLQAQAGNRKKNSCEGFLSEEMWPLLLADKRHSKAKVSRATGL